MNALSKTDGKLLLIDDKTDGKLLLIDDDVELCELLIEYLATEGFSVAAVHDGENRCIHRPFR